MVRLKADVSKEVRARLPAKLRVCKGATPHVLELCGEPIGENADEWSPARAAVEREVEAFANRGLRTVGVAECVDAADGGDGQWRFVALLTFLDPPRVDSAETIEKIKQSGVEVKMITGDHLSIAIETGKQLGMDKHPRHELQFHGRDFLDAVDNGARACHGVDVVDLVVSADGFAGVAPKHKYFIVDQLQKVGGNRALVAMTGDGVNDAPALHKADVGIAVHGATDAAKAAADLVLLSPGIGVINDAIQLSRSVFCAHRVVRDVPCERVV